jgi:hypothetical protein
MAMKYVDLDPILKELARKDRMSQAKRSTTFWPPILQWK